MKDLKRRIENSLILKIIELRRSNRLLRKALNESIKRERPYIDKINVLKSENRILKLKEVNLK